MSFGHPHPTAPRLSAVPCPPLQAAFQGGGRAAARPRPTSRLGDLLYVAFLIYVLVGVSPLSDASALVSGAGGVAEPAVALLLSGLACVILARRAQAARRLAADCWPLLLPLAWFCLSLAWAAFPDIALRRVVLAVLVVLICLGIGVGVGSLRRAHGLLVAVLALVVLADLAATALFPSFALTDIGVRGFHSQKNMAGIVGMLAVVAGVGWAVASRHPARIVAGLALAGLAGVFLQMTQSKTSILLALLGLVAVPALMLLRRFGAAARLVAGAGALTLLVGAAAAGIAFDLDLLALLTPGNDPTFTGRSDIWDFARAEIERRPWTGYGYGSFWDVGDVNDPLLRAPPGTWLSQNLNQFGSATRINQAHNGYLDLQLQGGLPGLVLAMTFMVGAIGALARKFLACDRGAEGAAIGTFLVIALLSLAHNMSESSFWIRGTILGSVTVLIGVLALRRESAASLPLSGPAGRRPR